jgi:hypothetical protein
MSASNVAARCGRVEQQIAVGLQVLADRVERKWCFVRLTVVAGRRADTRVGPLCVLSLDFFLAIQQRLHRAFARLRLKRIKRSLNAAQHDVQRNALLFPRLHQRPVHRTEKQVLAAPSDKRVLDFREVVEVIKS